MSKRDSCIIVGTGIAGLMAAERLRMYDFDVTLLEKSRGLGGRMAVKRIGEAIFDAGAQFMTTRELSFRQKVEAWLDRGLVQPWYLGPLRNMRYVGVEGMTSVAREMGRSLNVRLSEKVLRMNRVSDRWKVTTQPHGSDEEISYEADWLILTPPVPQCLGLLEASGIELDYDEEVELKRIRYLRCLTVMAVLKGSAGIANPGAMDLNHDTLRWIGDNATKGVSPVPGSVTIHSSPKFAEAHWDKPEEERISLMCAAAKPFLKSDVTEAISHRWGMSDPVRVYKEKQPFRKPYFIDEDLQLGMAGDGFNGPRIEAAAVSGRELASAITSPA